jgi:hypothetical protein
VIIAEQRHPGWKLETLPADSLALQRKIQLERRCFEVSVIVSKINDEAQGRDPGRFWGRLAAGMSDPLQIGFEGEELGDLALVIPFQ